MNAPVRIQLSRFKGWRPVGQAAVKVDRTTIWGNPFIVKECREAGFVGTDEELAARCVEAFRVWLTTPHWRNNWDGEQSERARTTMLERMPELRGKNLACWCPVGSPCHADVLLEVANHG